MPTPSIDDLRAAAARLPTAVTATPCVRSAWLTAATGREVWLKLESLQPTHSFKVRGAANVVEAAAVHGPLPPLVTASAGNHGAALAWAAQRRTTLTVFAPRSVPEAKASTMAALGAELRADAADYDAAERAALAWAARSGARYVSPYNDPLIVAGAGTIGLEIAAQVPGVREIVVPLGGGGLAAGVGIAVRSALPGSRLVAIEPEASPAFTTSLAAGRITPILVGDSLADGLTGNIEPGSVTFPLVRDGVHEVRRAGEAQIAGAIDGLLRHEHLVAEGAAAVAVAAVLNGPSRSDGGPIVVVLSGSNIDMPRLLAVVQAQTASR